MRTLSASFLQMGNTLKSACTKSFSWLEVIMSAYIKHCLSKGKYCKIPIISPGLTFVQKACWAYFRGRLFSEGLIIGRNFAFQHGLGLTKKTATM